MQLHIVLFKVYYVEANCWEARKDWITTWSIKGFLIKDDASFSLALDKTVT